jgi:hypothetical protein
VLGSEADLRAFIRQFEEGTWPSTRWNHATHITMGSYYLLTCGHEEATARIKHGLYHYHLSQGGQHTNTSGYHETLTLFWIDRIEEYLRGLPRSLILLEKVAAATQHFGGQRDLHKQHYTCDLTNDPNARHAWVAPDLTPN